MCFAACSSLSTSTKKDRRVIGTNNLSEYCYLTPGKIKGDKFTHFFFRQIQLANYRLQSKNNRKLEPSRFSVLAQCLRKDLVSSGCIKGKRLCVRQFSFSISLQTQTYFRSSEIVLRSQVTFKIINK